MNEYLEANRRHWDELVPMHLRSPYYDVDAFKEGKSSLHALERDELGDVRGKSLLHLQCHFGLDTLSWAREGAIVTGVDFSQGAIEAAQAIAHECGVEARFVVSDLYDLPAQLKEQFDIVYTSYGVTFWLPDMKKWAQVITRFLRPRGTFYMAEFHPVSGIFNHEPDATDLRIWYPYFPPAEPLRFEEDGSYADRDARLENRVTYSWAHPIGDVVTALVESRLRLEFLHEFPFTVERVFPSMEQGSDGYWRLTELDGRVPLLYSVKATKPG